MLEETAAAMNDMDPTTAARVVAAPRIFLPSKSREECWMERSSVPKG